MTGHQVCTVCVMDDRDPAIAFDDRGQCNQCRDAIARLPYEWWPTPEGRTRLAELIARIRCEMAGRPYDVMIGLSGGIDSSYLAHVLRHEFGLRILAVHVDGGWNTAAAVRNIELLVRTLGIDLYTYVVEWEEMRDLQLAYLKASVQNQDAPQDHAFFSTLYRLARKFGQRYFMSGVNFSGESIVPPGGYPAMDGRNLAAIYRAHGTIPLRTFPVMRALEFLWLTRVRRQIRIIRPLNYLPYDNEAAKRLLIETYGFVDYGGKHHESRFTKFYQEIYLPARYGFDKRRLHLSALIVAGQTTREAALRELRDPITTPEQIVRDKRFVAKKLGVPVTELDRLIALPKVPHTHYANSERLYQINFLQRSVRRQLSRALLGRRSDTGGKPQPAAHGTRSSE